MTKKKPKAFAYVVSQNDVSALLNEGLHNLAREMGKLTTLSESSPRPLNDVNSNRLIQYVRLLISTKKDVRDDKTTGTYAYNQLSLDELRALAKSVNMEVPPDLVMDHTTGTYKMLHEINTPSPEENEQEDREEDPQ